MQYYIIVAIIVFLGFFMVRKAANSLYHHDKMKKYFDEKYDYSEIEEKDAKK